MKKYLTSMVLILMVIGFANGQPISYVTPTGAGLKNGTSWENAYDGTHLQTAIDVGTGQVWVAGGTYYPTIVAPPWDPRSSSFKMQSGVAIYGGFNGTETLLSQRNWTTNVTILSGDIGTPDDKTDNTMNVIYNSGVGNTAVLDGFTIQGGNATEGLSGGGIYNNYSSPKLTNCTISGNSSTSFGGGIHNSIESYPVLTNCLILQNSASSGGGGIFNESASPVLINCTIAMNSAGSGGGIFNYSSNTTIKNSIIWGNTATTGNQICNSNSSTTTLNYTCHANGTNDNYSQGVSPFIYDGYCTTLNPQFVNPNTDFRIAGISPCADAGYGDYNTETTDIRGPGYGRKLLKTNASATGPIDMGAYEYKCGTDPSGLVAQGSRIYVKAEASGSSDGTSWVDAYTSLQTALSAATTNCQIWVAAGTYYPTTGTDQSISFNMKNDVAIYGGFSGWESAFSERNWATNTTTLSGNIGVTGDNTDNTNHVVDNFEVGITAILDGFTIQGGNPGSETFGCGMYNNLSSPTLTNNTITGNNGDGIYNYDHSSPLLDNCTLSENINGTGIKNELYSSPELNNCTIKLNRGAIDGGGMANYDHSSPLLSNCTISDNYAQSAGGGMYNNNFSNPTMDNCTITSNSSDGDGGGMYNYDQSSPQLSNCTITSNSSDKDGGGIYNYISSSPVMNTCNIIYNEAGIAGGGMSNYQSSPQMIDCYIFGNHAISGGGINTINSATLGLTGCTITGNYGINGNGGGMYNSGSTLELTNCYITGNYANLSPSNGGGIYSTGSTLTLTNCQLSDNIVNEDGGGICNESSSLSLINCTIANNSANNGGGISNRSSAPTIENSIIWGNAATSSGYQICNYSGTITLSYSCFANGTNNVNNSGTFTPDIHCINTNPRFFNPNNDFLIAGDSPCADAGKDEYNNEDFDIRGAFNVRKRLKTDASQSGPIDIGAYEYNAGNDPAEPEVFRIYVKANASGSGSGTSWDDAYTSLQEALSNAGRFYDIWVAAGTYYPTTDNDRDASFMMKNDVAIYGGFAGTEASLNDRNIATHVTILSGNIGNPLLSNDNSNHVVYNINVGSTAILDGFTIQGGWITGLGGGISNEFSSPAIANCTITGNFAYNGGGISNSMDSSPVLSNCTITSNSASNSGGGVFNLESSATLINCAISGNQSTSDGGGMFNSNSNTTLTNCTISGNSAQNGGGIGNYESSPVFTNCTISGNQTIGDGGGIYNLTNSSPVLTNCTISGNTAGFNGGGVGNWNSLPQFINCLIYGNSAISGGGIYNSSSSTLTNCTLTKNTADNGGGIYNASSSPTINNSIIWGNSTTSGGNGNQFYNLGTINLYNSCYASGDNDIQGGGTFSADVNSISADPKFVDVAGNDYRIFGNSPCTNTGFNTYNTTLFDIRGHARIQNTTIDMGAYEWTNGLDPGITWTGTASSNWNTPGNWSLGTVPLATSVVSIPYVTTDPIVNENPGTPAVCNDLMIETGAVLTIAAGKALTVSGTLANSAGADGLIIKSDINGTGSLITSSTPNAKVERYVDAWGTGGLHGWHLLSSPVSSQVIAGAFIDADPLKYDFYRWDETISALPWVNYKSGDFTVFAVGQGYLCAYQTTSIKSFTGVLNSASTSTLTLSRSGVNSYPGWNLLGNPFPSAIQWNKSTTDWALNNIISSAKIWNEAGASYTDIAQNGIIPAMQGFMVQVSSGTSGSLVIPAVDRVHNATAWYKNTEGEIKLIAHDPDNSTAQESIIKVSESATEGFDSQYDSHFLAGYAPMFYSTAGSEQLSTNTLPGIDNSRIIPMEFVKNAGTNFSIELAESSINGVSTIYLTDKKTGTVTDLSKTLTYNFTASENDDANRFSLSFATAYGINPEISNGMQVYTYDKTLFVTQTDPQKGTIQVYNISGQLLFSQSLESSTSQSISLQGFATGVYMVTIHTEKGLYNQKIVVN